QRRFVHLLCVYVFCVCVSQINITAKSGENAILPCQDPGNDFTGVKWRRPDQDDEYIFLERDGHVVEYDQHPSVKNRTVLQKKDGNVSLILKNVTTNDTGLFECLVFINESYKSIRIIYLHVDPPGEGEAASWGPFFVRRLLHPRPNHRANRELANPVPRTHLLLTISTAGRSNVTSLGVVKGATHR
uniref:Ig-like domain-containing protein n=1 Tax=Maylandia zebra TaxID=106582 RepID=A0A3P9D7D0_9CICH